MSRRTAVSMAWAVWSAGTATAVVALWFAARATSAGLDVPTDQLRFPLALLVNAAGFVTVGVFLGARLPRHPIGWLLAAWGTVMVATAAAGTYEVAVLAAGEATETLVWVRWSWAVLWHPMFVLLFLILLLFPDGRVPSPRWRPFAWFAVGWYGLLAIAIAFSTVTVSLYAEDARPPEAIPTSAFADAAVGVLLPGQVVLLVVALVALLLRLSRSTGRVRVQISWFVYAVTVAVLAFAAGVLLLGGGVLFPVFLAIPVAAGYAVVKQQLYDVGRVVRRTVSYSLVVGALSAVYVVGVLTLQRLLPAGASEVAVALSTLAAAAAFRPVRRRMQRAVDRRFHRAPYDAPTIEASFAHRLRDEVSLETVTAALAEVSARSVQPSSVHLWLVPPASASQTRRSEP